MESEPAETNEKRSNVGLKFRRNVVETKRMAPTRGDDDLAGAPGRVSRRTTMATGESPVRRGRCRSCELATESSLVNVEPDRKG